jgi:hypothetical protein
MRAANEDAIMLPLSSIDPFAHARANSVRRREPRHILLRFVWLLLPLMILAGCESASSGHAPGLAGGQTLTPGTTNYPLAYIKVPFPTNKIAGTDSTDIAVTDLITSIPGGDLYVRGTASSAGAEVNVTGSITGGKGSVRDLDVSADGTKVVFALRLPLTAGLKNTDPKQPNWHIYQYDAIAKTVTQLTNDDITAGHDVGPRYLPDGRIVFASSRQTTTEEIELDEGRPQYPAQTEDRSAPIFALHVMNADGSNIHQISFNTNHDFLPSVMNDGQVLFSRWEVTGGKNQISLYHANPDGTGLELYYGAHSHATGANIAGTNTNVIQFLNARQRPDGKTLALVRPMLGTQFGGDAVLIDGENYVEINQMATPASLTGVGQTEATALGITTDANLPSPGGRFASIYPLFDGTNRMLVSWSPCLVEDTTVTPAATEVCNSNNSTGANVTMAPPQYSIWLYDFDAGTLSPVLSAESGTMVLEPVILQARKPIPPILTDGSTIPLTTTAQNLVNNGVGILNITSVYDFDGAPPPNDRNLNVASLSNPTLTSDTPNYYTVPYRFIRIVKSVEIPDRTVRRLDASIFGPAGMGMREILGYAPIQQDGSVQLQVPANVPFTIDILDANGRRVTSQHTSWIQLIPGETKTCNGCHVTSNATRPSHGRGGLTASINPGAPIAGAPLPGTNSVLIAANAGDTMGAVLAENTCGSTNTTQTAPTCSQVLSTDLLYTPIWTTGVTLPTGFQDNPIAYTYSGTNGLPELPPANASCMPWTAQCRVDIHYASAQSPTQLYIQALWNLTTRPAVTFKGTSSLNGTTGSPTCVNCHNTVNTMSAIQVPAGQLDLTGGASTVDPTIVTSYEILLFPHDEQTLNMGVLTDTLVSAPGPTTVMVPISLPAPMTAGSAIDSGAFLNIFYGGQYQDPVLDHTGWLSPAELRLISEWLDIGGQYYNDPFVAPAAN